LKGIHLYKVIIQLQKFPNQMRRLLVSEWVTLDGVYDADSMPQWEIPYNSDDKWNFIKEGILSCDAMLIGRVTYEMFAAFWPTQKNNEMGVADKMNNVSKYVVSKTLEKADWNNSIIIKIT
jgi:dihydrofolate reductase